MRAPVRTTQRRSAQTSLCLAALLSVLAFAQAAAEPWRLLLDLDRTRNPASAHAIEMGVRTALAAAGNRLGGRAVEVVPLDNRGNVKRALLSLRAYLDDPNALAVVGGIHSPPYLRYREMINREGVLTLLPWSSAAPITRPEGPDNWIFRLSVDDDKMGERIVGHAVERSGCQQPALLLLKTGWGRSAEDNMGRALAARGLGAAPVFWFDDGIGAVAARLLARDIASAGADCVLLAASPLTGAALAKALDATATNEGQTASPIRIFAHWGIIAGPFTDHVGHGLRQRLGLRVLQTCALLTGARRRAAVFEVLAHAKRLYPDTFAEPESLPAQAGFIHAHDLTRLLIAAAEQSAIGQDGPASDIHDTRRRLRAALQSLERPVEGLIRQYSQPFAPWQGPGGDRDAHEALGLADLCMARFDARGRLHAIPNTALDVRVR
ncbi:MAG: ABC transporter substrate-binding protein [Pseudomonadota bacterium]